MTDRIFGAGILLWSILAMMVLSTFAPLGTFA